MKTTVGILLFLTAGLLVWVGFGTVKASRDESVRSGLDYQVFLGAVDDLLAGAGDTTLLRFDEVEARLSPLRMVTFDTITILADVREFPAFDQAGFLYDQVQAYNRFQRDRLAHNMSRALVTSLLGSGMFFTGLVGRRPKRKHSSLQ